MVEPLGLGTATARDAADRILETAGVATVPGSAFYADGGGESLVRLSFAKTDADLEEACRRLRNAFG
jgi:aminotransferase